MQSCYITVLEGKTIQIVVKRSKFIGNICYARNKDEAVDFIKHIRLKYKDATHNVPAYNIYSGGLTYYSDDKEPHATAGKPILDVLKKEGVYDVCVVVTRYFGGVLLGTGGLVAAYSNSCKQLIKNATLAKSTLCDCFNVLVDYKYVKKVELVFSSYNVNVVEKVFTNYVEFKILVERIYSKKTRQNLVEVTNGEALIYFVKSLRERVKI